MGGLGESVLECTPRRGVTVDSRGTSREGRLTTVAAVQARGGLSFQGPGKVCEAELAWHDTQSCKHQNTLMELHPGF